MAGFKKSGSKRRTLGTRITRPGGGSINFTSHHDSYAIANGNLVLADRVVIGHQKATDNTESPRKKPRVYTPEPNFEVSPTTLPLVDGLDTTLPEEPQKDAGAATMEIPTAHQLPHASPEVPCGMPKRTKVHASAFPPRL